jgi:hypothetical protein
LVALAVAALMSFQAEAQQAAKVEVLYQGKRQAVVCNGTNAIIHMADFDDQPPLDSRLTADVERLTITPTSDVVRQTARIYPGFVSCKDDYVWSYAGTLSGHSVLSVFRWPYQIDSAPILLGSAPDYDLAGPGLIFEPRSSDAPTVDCSPLFRLRLPFGEGYPSNLLASELDRPPMLSLPEGSTRAFVAVTSPERTCIGVYPLNGSTIANPTADCALEVAGRVFGMAATSDRQLLIVATEDRSAPTFRLLKVSGL